MGRGGFYKGEKKKPKKGSEKGVMQTTSSAPIFTLPKLIEKKKNEK